MTHAVRVDVQGPHAQCNNLGFFPVPTTTKAAAVSLSSFTLATTPAAGTPSDWAPEGLHWFCRSAPLHAADSTCCI